MIRVRQGKLEWGAEAGKDLYILEIVSVKEIFEMTIYSVISMCITIAWTGAFIQEIREVKKLCKMVEEFERLQKHGKNNKENSCTCCGECSCENCHKETE